MCSLPNIQVRNPEEHLPPIKNHVEKTEAKAARIIIPNYPSLENSI
jgi:hypothetical protein